MLKRIQYHSFEQWAVNIYSQARTRYLESQRLLGVETAIVKQVRTLTICEPQSLRAACEFLAALYRFRRSDTAQMMLFDDGRTHEDRLGADWQTHIQAQSIKLSETSRLCLAILRAAISWGTPEEPTRQKELANALRDKFGDVGTLARVDLHHGRTRRAK